jgi:aspartyl-tRNA synthetase
VIREQYHSEPAAFTAEPCIVHWPEAMAMLKAAGVEGVDDFGDLTGAQELRLGEMVKEKYGADFFILDKYPSAVRPFYTMPDPQDGRYSNSYDMFLRGQEICSGAQRIHDPELLVRGFCRLGGWRAGLSKCVVAATTDATTTYLPFYGEVCYQH